MGRMKFIPKPLPFYRKRKWLYLGLLLLLGLALFLIFGLPALLGPRLSKSQQEWTKFQGDDPKGYPLEVVSHGYRMIRAYRSEPQTDRGNPSRTANLVEWEWKVLIKNKSNRDEKVFVNYFLVDKDHLPVDGDYVILPRSAPGWETVTIQHQTEMVYEDLPRVATGVWEISWGEGKFSSRTRRNGF